jgi:hypothetical protein
MGDGIQGHISKGPIHTKVDAVLNRQDQPGGPFVRRAAFLAALMKAATAIDYLALIESEANVDPADVNYLRATWYSTGPNGWWPALQPIYPILQQGLIKTIQEAGDQLLIDSYWLPGLGASGVEVIVARSPRQVTRLIVTPPSPGSMRTRHTNVPMWVVKGRSGAQEHPGFATGDEVVEAVSGNVLTWRRRELP